MSINTIIKKYSTNRTGGPLVVTILLAIGMLSGLTSPHVQVASSPFLLVLLFCLISSMDLFFGTFVIVNDVGVYAVDYCFYKQGLTFHEMQSVDYGYTWGPRAPRARTLIVSGTVNGKIKEIRLGTNHFYSQKTLAAIVKEIRERKPSVRIDSDAQSLLEHYS